MLSSYLSSPAKGFAKCLFGGDSVNLAQWIPQYKPQILAKAVMFFSLMAARWSAIMVHIPMWLLSSYYVSTLRHAQAWHPCSLCTCSDTGQIDTLSSLGTSPWTMVASILRWIEDMKSSDFIEINPLQSVNENYV